MLGPYVDVKTYVEIKRKAALFDKRTFFRCRPLTPNNDGIQKNEQRKPRARVLEGRFGLVVVSDEENDEESEEEAHVS